MAKAHYTPQEEDEQIKQISQKVKAEMVPSPYDRFLTVHIDKQGRIVRVAISLKDEIAMGRNQ